MASEHEKCANCGKDFVKRLFQVLQAHPHWCLKCNGDAGRIGRDEFIASKDDEETAPAPSYTPSYSPPDDSPSPSFGGGDSIFGGGDSGGGFSGGGGDSGGGGASGGW